MTVLLTLLALASSGCAAPADAEEPPADDAPRTSGGDGEDALATIDAGICSGAIFVMEVPMDWVRAELPPERPPAGVGDDTIGFGLNNPHLMAFECPSVDVNGTAVEDLSVAFSGTLLADGSFYRWDWFVDEPAAELGTLLEHLGWPAFAASIEITATGLRVEGDGILYDVQAPRDPLVPSSIPFTKVVHGTAPDGTSLVLHEELWTGSQLLSGGVLTPTGGVLERIAANADGRLAGSINNLNSPWKGEFSVAETV